MSRLVLLALVVSAASAHAETACLPKSALGENAPGLVLGVVAGAPVLCAEGDGDHGGVTGCWGVDPKTGALSVDPATPIPGQSVRWKVDAKGCVDGYCTTPKAAADDSLLYATSADGANAVVLRERVLHVFDAKTKKQLKTIPIMDEKAPDDQNVGNEPIQLFYLGDMIYVVGTDAGPYIAVWGFNENGARAGLIKSNATEGFSVFGGGVGALDDGRIALSDSGTRHVAIVTAKGGRTDITRATKNGPCKPEEIESLADPGELSKACQKHIDKVFMPFAGVQFTALPSGDLLMLMSGKLKGQLAVLDGAKLTEKKRLKLKVCKK